jgi:hypothetical protein
MSESSAEHRIAADRGVARLKMYIGGQWRAGSSERDIFDPYRGERVACAT